MTFSSWREILAELLQGGILETQFQDMFVFRMHFFLTFKYGAH